MREKTLPSKKSPGSDSFMGEHCHTHEEEILLILLKPFQNINTKQIFLNPFLIHPASSSTKQIKDTVWEKNYNSISPVNTGIQILQETLVNTTTDEKEQSPRSSGTDSEMVWQMLINKCQASQSQDKGQELRIILSALEERFEKSQCCFRVKVP